MNFSNIKFLLPALFFSSTVTHAEVLQLSYTDANNIAVTVSPIQEYINPQGSFNVIASGGLDLKLRIIITDINDTIIHNQTSGTIGIEDELNIEGKTYFGKKLTVPSLSDGIYTFTVETIDTVAGVIQSDAHSYTKDTVAPSFGDISISAYGGVNTHPDEPGVWYTTNYSTNRIYLNNISDATSGIGKIEAYSVVGGSEYVRGTASFDAITQRADIGNGSGYFPNGNNATEKYQLTYEVYDRAGNKAVSAIQSLYYDSYTAGSVVAAVYNPSSSNVIAGKVGFDPYTPGMKVYTNPIQWMSRIPLTNYYDSSKNVMGGEYFVGAAEVVKDEMYAYGIYKRSYGFRNTNYVRVTQRGHWSTGSISYDLVLDESVPKSPVRLSAQYLFSDTGWNNWRRQVNTPELPLQVLAVRQTVQPRSYVQIFSHHGASCRVEPNESECIAEFASPLELRENSYGNLHGGSSVSSEDGQLTSEPSWASVHWNGSEIPQITNHEWDINTKTLKAWVTQPNKGYYFDTIRVVDMYITDNDVRIGATVKASTLVGGNYYIELVIEDLVEGEHDLTFVAQETHQNYGKLDFAKVFIDATAPTINITNNNIANFAEITGLEGLNITLDDAYSDAKIIEVELKGGPISTATYLAWKSLGDGQYGLQYPRIFPSLNPGDDYTLKVTASDTFNNESTSEKTFTYIPPNLKRLGTLTTLAVNLNILDNNNLPLSSIKATLMRDNAGQLANGPQNMIFSLRSDANFDVLVQGVLVKVGQTVTMTVNAINGTIDIPVYPAVKGMGGHAAFFAEFPVISAN
jgi:hypothetical protein